MTARIYKLPLPEATTRDERDSLGTRLAEQGVLDGDAVVEALSSEAADLTLTGQYAYGRYYSELVAAELEELADSSIGSVPFYGGPSGRAGYYEIASADVEPVHAGGRDIWQWSLSLTSQGTRKSHLQTLRTRPSQPSPSHPFGNDTDGLVGIPAAAQTVRALDAIPEPTTRLRPTPTSTVTTEFGDVDLYDATALSIDDPTFVYSVAKDAQPAVDARIYDTNGRASKFIESSGGRVRAWQSVFATDHEFDGDVVLSNGRIRVTIDEPTATDASTAFDAESYDAGTGSWSAVSLPSYDAGDLNTDWQPADVDLTRIGQARTRAQVEWEAVAGTNAGDIYALAFELERGIDTLNVWRLDGEGAIPADLESLLAPIASSSVVDTAAEQGLTPRDGVRR